MGSTLQSSRARLSCARVLPLLLGALACGPPKAGTEASTSSTEGGDESSTTEVIEPGTETGGTTETETGDGDTNDDFVPDIDIPPPSCDMFLQDCPDGEKCVLYSNGGGGWDGHKCVPVLGDQAAGEPCTWDGITEATDNCDESSACWDGTCLGFCTGTPDDPECPPGSSCLIASEFSPVLCIYQCDPLLQDCAPGLGCYWAVNDFQCIFTSDELPPGEPCGFINECAAGLICMTSDVLPACIDAACCSPFCDLDLGDAQCQVVPGTSCVPFYEQGMAPAGSDNVGVCILP